MKVKCIIKAEWGHRRKFITKGILWWRKTFHAPTNGPKLGDILTVKHHFWADGLKFYVFIEWPGNNAYDSRLFEPLEEVYEKITSEKIKECASVN